MKPSFRRGTFSQRIKKCTTSAFPYPPGCAGLFGKPSAEFVHLRKGKRVSLRVSESPFPPLSPPLSRRSHILEKLKYGNIFSDPFEAVWERKEYAEFKELLCHAGKKVSGLLRFSSRPDKMKGISADHFLRLPFPVNLL